MAQHTEEEARHFALGALKEQYFHVRCIEKIILEENQVQRRVIEHLFFCNSEQICLAKKKSAILRPTRIFDRISNV